MIIIKKALGQAKPRVLREINIEEYTEGYFRDIGEGITERIDERTSSVTGIAILSFKKRTEKMKDFPSSPFIPRLKNVGFLAHMFVKLERTAY